MCEKQEHKARYRPVHGASGNMGDHKGVRGGGDDAQKRREHIYRHHACKRILYVTLAKEIKNILLERTVGVLRSDYFCPEIIQLFR